MRHDDQPVDLLVTGIGEREHRPVGRAFARRLLHATDDAVRAGRSRHRDRVGIGLLELGDAGEVDRGDVGTHVDGLDRVRGRRAEQRNRQKGREQYRAPEAQTTPSASHPIVTGAEFCPNQLMGAEKPLKICRIRGHRDAQAALPARAMSSPICLNGQGFPLGRRTLAGGGRRLRPACELGRDLG